MGTSLRTSIKLTDVQMKMLDEVVQKRGGTKTEAMRQALRLYLMIHTRTDQGGRLIFEDNSGKLQALVML